MTQDSLRQDSQANNKRIAKNTFFLYFRMLFLMLITFYTSRVVLDKLGVVDFGIHNVVGGLATMFVFFRSSLANVTQRYLNVELGKQNIKEAHNVFCQHQTLYLFISLFVFLCAESIGLWFVSSQLNVPSERHTAAIWVYQFTIMSLIITIMSVVYDAAIVAHEDMKIYSYVGIVEGLCKLLIAFVISVISFDSLITYSFLLSIVAVGVITFYIYYCSRKYDECHFVIKWNRQHVKEAFSMIGWNTVGTAVWAINNQGIDVLLNIFFGPAVNAAKGIASQVDRAVNNFGQNFFIAVRPQLVKSYAAKDFDYLYKLFFSSSKFSVYLLWLICLPIILCVDTILTIWLKEVPDYTSSFTILTLIYSVINILNNPIWSLALAIGELKWYIVIGSGVFFMTFPLSFVCLAIGCPPESVIAVNIVVRVVYIVVVIRIVNRYLPIPIAKYFGEVIKPVVMVLFVSGATSWGISKLLPDIIYGRILTCVVSIVFIVICILYLGLKQNERNQLYMFVLKKIKVYKK